ncbi:MAG: Txe/YoeB family addiction module toxin [Burkholderiales bacterium]
MKRTKKSKPISPEESTKPLELVWTANASEDLAYWRRKNKKLAQKDRAAHRDGLQHPFTGLGKPEHELRGYWSRRVSVEHRLTYRVEAGVLYIAKCRFHYTEKKKK